MVSVILVIHEKGTQKQQLPAYEMLLHYSSNLFLLVIWQVRWREKRNTDYSKHGEAAFAFLAMGSGQQRSMDKATGAVTPDAKF